MAQCQGKSTPSPQSLLLWGGLPVQAGRPAESTQLVRSLNAFSICSCMPTTTERAQEGIYWLAILVLEKPVCQHGL
ncbi:hypothetical protein Y1Q_0006233 [Alligator mississippiensis]|uniref:Uncharacterized protein n=1 Tax=Alligator mississippiensis TaxID=8496 RepID=A0A151NXB0_ALLMI|nr:hypothetical protein Y1Q_0006233 [Alligator mississippiensis]